MDKGTDCRDVLLGRSLRLKHGWVAVVNRGQADINTNVRASGGCLVSCVCVGCVMFATPEA